eukprot:scaffold11257_cov133-Isochrysis_galbana.AAC.1
MLATTSCCSSVELATSWRAMSGRERTAPLTEATSRSIAVGGCLEEKCRSSLAAPSMATWLARPPEPPDASEVPADCTSSAPEASSPVDSLSSLPEARCRRCRRDSIGGGWPDLK